MMPSHAPDRVGVEGAAGGAAPGGGEFPDGSPGGADGVAGGASGSASDMTSQRYYGALEPESAASLASKHGVASGWRCDSAIQGQRPTEPALFAGWHGLC